MDIKLKCACGAVEGKAHNITSKNGNRIVCCCDDCQAFARHLGTQDDTLDEFGGTEIYQTSLAQVTIHQGQEHLRCMRLSSKGLLRWYTDCCKTPVGNTVSVKFPFVGLIHNFMAIDGNRAATLGPVLAHIQVKHAQGSPSYPDSAQAFPIGITLRMISKVLLWKVKGMSRPSVFFDEAGKAAVKPVVLQEASAGMITK